MGVYQMHYMFSVDSKDPLFYYLRNSYKVNFMNSVPEKKKSAERTTVRYQLYSLAVFITKRAFLGMAPLLFRANASVFKT
jgi:hypothetical protein